MSISGVWAAAIWWPEDRARCVGTDIDLMSTYIGGRQEVIDALLVGPGLEVLEVVERRVSGRATLAA